MGHLPREIKGMFLTKLTSLPFGGYWRAYQAELTFVISTKISQPMLVIY